MALGRPGAAGAEAAAEHLVQRGRAPLDVRGEDGFLPLHLACMNGYEQVVALLLHKGGARPGAGAGAGAEEGGLTPLLCACRSGYDMIVSMLVRAGVDVNAGLDGGGRTSLQFAASRCSVDVVRALVEAGASPDETDHEGRTPLHFAASDGQPETLAYVMGLGSLDLNAQTSPLPSPSTTLEREGGLSALTPLHMACLHGRADNARALLQGGAEPYPLCSQGRTPFACAVDRGFEGVVEVLLGLGVHPVPPLNPSPNPPPTPAPAPASSLEREGKVANSCGGAATIHAPPPTAAPLPAPAPLPGSSPQNHPLLTSVRRGNAPMVRVLLRGGCDPDMPLASGHGPLHVAALHGCSEVARELLQGGACPWAAWNCDRRSPLHVAAGRGARSLCVMEELLPKLSQEEINACDNLGKTPLMTAISSEEVATEAVERVNELNQSVQLGVCGLNCSVHCDPDPDPGPNPSLNTGCDPLVFCVPCLILL
ncbi:unnamed protein product [Discosporangium mesarthrocarpum]